MKIILTIIALSISISLLAATPSTKNFEVRSGQLTLPEVKVTSEIPTYTVTLRQLPETPDVFQMDSLIPTDNSSTFFNPLNGILFIPSLTLGIDTYKNVQMQLINTPPETPSFRIVNFEIDREAIKVVFASVETEPVPAVGDAADDVAIWVHPSDPALSVIIGTQKQGGLGVYDLKGAEIQYLSDGHMNNVDLRYHFPLGGESVDLVVFSRRDDNSLAIYKINPNKRKLEKVAARTIQVKLPDAAYGLCMYHSPLSGKYYAFINDKTGAVEQWELFEEGRGKVDAKLVRSFGAKSQVEGCVADDVHGNFYLAEEQVGIWQFPAEPDSGKEGTLIDVVTKNNGHLVGDIEGLTIYYTDEKEGYLIASSQGNSTYCVYNRTGNHEYLGKFKISANPTTLIDEVSDTDGIDLVNTPLGPQFPNGVFIAQDGANENPDENQNFKLVPLEQINHVLKLGKGTFYNPRQ